MAEVKLVRGMVAGAMVQTSEENAARLGAQFTPEADVKATASQSSTNNGDPSELRGKALDKALEAAGLPKTGTAAEKRAALAAASDNQ